ncbi:MULTISPECIES: hypothetical protein [unclassified Lentimicrobium]|uniref:hypothetical protein n=1 Tax=unclassified Lentimicrobium TaxID=2677434 RepID=UPI001551EA4E|nr:MULTISPECIES: hypothetical protein [unclassified Lentimicrobium]NPD47550.1 hypothetical protein [Lentimicrobium sp. S6]NPD86359.1 hypothetical protein [Lentimicrobium sp. L6]
MKAYFIVFILFLGVSVYSQDIKPKTSSEAKKELLFFSNDGCGKCSVAQNYFETHDMPFTKYAVKENRPMMYQYINKKPRQKKAGVGYPVLVYGDSVYFSISNINSTLKEIKKMMNADGLLETKEAQ